MSSSSDPKSEKDDSSSKIFKAFTSDNGSRVGTKHRKSKSVDLVKSSSMSSWYSLSSFRSRNSAPNSPKINRKESSNQKLPTEQIMTSDSALCEFILRACTLMAMQNVDLKSRIEAKQTQLRLEKLQVDSLSSRNFGSKKEVFTAQNNNSFDSSCKTSKEDEEEEGGILRKLNDMRQRLGFLRKRQDGQSSVRPEPEEVITWADDFNNLMASKYGQTLFKAFLQREFSEENVEFWLAVEEYKNTRSGKLHSKACKIHNDYVAVQAPKEINLDSATRSQITSRLDSPDKNLFDVAQKRVQALMESDSYLRFLQSELYKELLDPDHESADDSS